MSASHNPFRRRAAAAVVAAVLGVPAVAAAAPTPSSYDAGIPPGMVEHGVVSSVLTGAPSAWNHRIEYWVSADRWREQTTDARTGELLGGRLHDAGGTTWLQYKPVNGDPRVLHFSGNDSVPGPGLPAPYNRVLAETGVMGGTAKYPIMVTLQPIGPQTIAGFAGTRYEQLSNGQPGQVAVGHGPIPDSHTIVVLQDGTYQPLMTDASAPNGRYGRIDQRETLVSRETTPTAQASVRLTKESFARTVKSWKAKVAKAKANKKKHKK
ncbi:MAG TPA: hypothetical protein VFG42_09295 [Baekduia sp.]|uniref:hypothetical protein n=1 Tax=Baekduia sp. TaxID=2600305 RepID=UPI002D76F733|nr:hypothetical protein [Baekduia sp.]HET6506972.1 hypothetical protein [Baekduia sp.]